MSDIAERCEQLESSLDRVQRWMRGDRDVVLADSDLQDLEVAKQIVRQLGQLYLNAPFAVRAAARARYAALFRR